MRPVSKYFVLGFNFIIGAGVGVGATFLIDLLLWRPIGGRKMPETPGFIIMAVLVVLMGVFFTWWLFKFEMKYYKNHYKACDECKSFINIKATRCPKCGVKLPDGST
jgi:ribosomal protein L40E